MRDAATALRRSRQGASESPLTAFGTRAPPASGRSWSAPARLGGDLLAGPAGQRPAASGGDVAAGALWLLHRKLVL